MLGASHGFVPHSQKKQSNTTFSLSQSRKQISLTLIKSEKKNPYKVRWEALHSVSLPAMLWCTLLHHSLVNENGLGRLTGISCHLFSGTGEDTIVPWADSRPVSQQNGARGREGVQAPVVGT